MNSIDQAPFDWSLVDKLNPETIIRQSEVKLVRSFVKMILNTDFQGLNQSSFKSRDLPKLLILFQATTKLLYNSQKQCQNMCNDRTKKYIEAVEEINKLKQNEKFLTKSLQGEVCPLCKKRFKSFDYLNRHIKTKHSDKFAAWESFIQNTQNSAQNKQNANEQTNSSRENQQPKHEIQLKFTKCGSITIENSLPQKKKAEPRPVFELDEEEPQPNDSNIFVNNNYIKNKIPPIQKIHAKTPRGKNTVPPFHNNIQQSISQDIFINDSIEQNKLNNNNNQFDTEMTSSQIDMANIAASNIIKDMKEIAHAHKKHHSTPQTPKENPQKYDKNAIPNQSQNAQQPNSHYTKAQTPDTGKRTKTTIIPQDEQAQTPHQRKERQPHHQQQPQQQQQITQDQQETSRKQSKRPQTPPAISSRKKQPDDQSHRPSTTDSLSNEPQQKHRQQKRQQQQQQQQQQIQQQQQYNQQQQQQQQQQIQQQQQYNQQQQQQQIQQQQQQQQQDTSKFGNEENEDPFIIENDEDNENNHEEERNPKHVEFTTAQLDDLIQQSDNEEAEGETQPQTPKKRRKKHRKVIQMPEGIIPSNNEISSTNNNDNASQEVKFNFKGTKSDNQHNTEQVDMINNSPSKLKLKKPTVTFINDDNYENKPNQQQQQQQQQQHKEEIKIGIVKRVDAQSFKPESFDDDNIQIAHEIKNETKTVKRMGGYEIPNYELDEILATSQSEESYE